MQRPEPTPRQGCFTEAYRRLRGGSGRQRTPQYVDQFVRVARAQPLPGHRQRRCQAGKHRRRLLRHAACRRLLSMRRYAPSVRLWMLGSTVIALCILISPCTIISLWQ